MVNLLVSSSLIRLLPACLLILHCEAEGSSPKSNSQLLSHRGAPAHVALTIPNWLFQHPRPIAKVRTPDLTTTTTFSSSFVWSNFIYNKISELLSIHWRGNAELLFHLVGKSHSPGTDNRHNLSPDAWKVCGIQALVTIISFLVIALCLALPKWFSSPTFISLKLQYRLFWPVA